MAPLLDEVGGCRRPLKSEHRYFYSISNTQTGLKGVSFGDSLIKHVVETAREFPKAQAIRHAVAHSGSAQLAGQEWRCCAGWAGRQAKGSAGKVMAEWRFCAFAGALDDPGSLPEKSVVRGAAMFCAALSGAGNCRVARSMRVRFHLGSGAHEWSVWNWAADPQSTKGLKQSMGLMVNYLYDLKRLDNTVACWRRARFPFPRRLNRCARDERMAFVVPAALASCVA